jgi:TPR repeat protein
MHAKGQEQLERGNVQPARLYFQRAAEAGLAQSALALGATYDPEELVKLKVVGLQPDLAAARRWFEKARELGAAEAADRLRRLANQ